jgi:imidazolonepropionase
MNNKKTLIGPFRQLLPMTGLPLRGPLSDDALAVLEDGAVLCADGRIVAVGEFEALRKGHNIRSEDVVHLDEPLVGLPGLIDAHTHICYAGSRAGDYAARLAGKTYLEIAQSGGGIWDTVQRTRQASFEELAIITQKRAEWLLRQGVTTAEVKSGYALSVREELKMLRVIQAVDQALAIDLIPTCLAAHIQPKDFDGSARDYLAHIAADLLPVVLRDELARRLDIFVEDTAFSVEDAEWFLRRGKALGLALTVHADQFSAGGSRLAVALGAHSADHLEASGEEDIRRLAQSEVSAVVLPGASLGLGIPFAPARRLLDAGCSLAIASDWNPGSAPMGDLLTQAALLGAYEKLTMAETTAGLTCRAAHALRLADRGSLQPGNLADIAAFNTTDYREIFYQQGRLKARGVWKRGRAVFM